MWKKLKHYAAHYLFGLCTSCWNAGIHALKINGGISMAAVAAPQVMPMPNLHEMIGIFVAAAVYEAIDYFGDNPLPTRLDALDASAAHVALPPGATAVLPAGSAIVAQSTVSAQ